ncbi:MAG: type IV toxin-antitoxin system AbiEi family antitoxin domain-containing protein [Solirubrobacterales bacterium]|nr:type IV toxin-antitoxin system AbiEi family antitoxin domain-containing protein [Solirubrobacterales bacterium]
MGDKPPIGRKIAQLAARQQRNLTRPQLLAAGLGAKAIDYRLKHGRLHPTGYRGVYAVGCPPITPQERAMAAVLAGGPGAVLSHGSALCLWGVWNRWDTPFEVSVRTDRRPRGVRVHRARIHDRDTTRHFGIPVTMLAKALLDQAPHMTTKSLNRAINTGRQDRHLHVSQLVEVVGRYPTHRGRPKLEYCIGIAPQRPSRSGFEDDFLAFCERYGLPRPETNTTVCGYEVDVLFVAEKVIVELDGWPFHSSRTSFESDRDRDADTAAAGFLTVRITGERFDNHPEREARRLLKILEQRRLRAA